MDSRVGPWVDRPDKWTPAIAEAFPTRSGRHDLFQLAAEMVGNRHGKYELVSLVNWLLLEKEKAEAERTVRCMCGTTITIFKPSDAP